MFDGVPPPRRRNITTREARTLARLEDAAAIAQWEADRVTQKWQRYVELINARQGTRGMSGSRLISEWIVQKLNATHP